MKAGGEDGVPAEVATHLPMHPVEFGVLMVLSEGVRHGYDIVQTVPLRVPVVRDIYPANLYRRLRRLRDRGLIQDVEPAGAVVDDGRDRKFFEITPLGLSVARAEAERLRRLVELADGNPALAGGAPGSR